MAGEEPLLQALAESLPQDLHLDFHYIATAPSPCSALFSSPPNRPEEDTSSESHFLTASRPSEEPLIESGIFVFGIEVLIFSTPSLTTIFVSKADSTGNLGSSKIQSGSPSIIKTLCHAFLSFLIKSKFNGPRIVLSLFARAQPQYLFPGSSDNPNKHVLEDRQLIKWWARTIDPLLDEFSSSDLSDGPVSAGATPEAYLVVPGCDKYQTRSFFPSGPLQDGKQRWTNSYPVDLMAHDPSAPLRCLIPRLPDDPKARFLLDLDSEISEQELLEKGQWRSVRSLDQFWEMMSYRQECAAGRLVGFIWVVITPIADKTKTTTNSQISKSSSSSQDGSQVQQLPTPVQSQSRIVDPTLPPISHDSNGELDTISTQSPPPSPSLIRSADPTIETPEQPTTSDPPSKQSIISQVTSSSEPTKIISSFPTLLTPAAYETLQNHLLDNTDFSTPSLAAESTLSWTRRAAELAELIVNAQPSTPKSSISSEALPPKLAFWGKSIVGRRKPLDKSSSQTLASTNDALNGKVSGTPSAFPNPPTSGHVNTLGMSMIRKKRKAPPSDFENGDCNGGVAAATSSSSLNPELPAEKQGEGSLGGATSLSPELLRNKRRATPGIGGIGGDQ